MSQAFGAGMLMGTLVTLVGMIMVLLYADHREGY